VTAAPRFDTPRPKSANQAYFPALDGVRGFAFLLVFVWHYLTLPWAWAGVNLFFVLSGFLITGILFDTRDDPHRFRNFYVRRTLRIFPVYYGVILLILLAYPVFHWEWNWAWLAWPLYLGNLSHIVRVWTPDSPMARMAFGELISGRIRGLMLNLGHFWSLCLEEQFYLFWPCIVFLVRGRKKLIWICAACVMIEPFLRIAASHLLATCVPPDHNALYFVTPFRVDSLLLGGSIALVRRGPAARTLYRGGRVVFVLCSTALVVWLALRVGQHRPGDYVYPLWRNTWGLSLIDIYSASLLLTALEPGSPVYRIFNIGPLRWLGRISYGAYVFHNIYIDPVRQMMRPYGDPSKLKSTAVGFVITIVLAWASFRWFESPFIRLKDRWTR